MRVSIDIILGEIPTCTIPNPSSTDLYNCYPSLHGCGWLPHQSHLGAMKAFHSSPDFLLDLLFELEYPSLSIPAVKLSTVCPFLSVLRAFLNQSYNLSSSRIAFWNYFLRFIALALHDSRKGSSASWHEPAQCYWQTRACLWEDPQQTSSIKAMVERVIQTQEEQAVRKFIVTTTVSPRTGAAVTVTSSTPPIRRSPSACNLPPQ